MSHGRTFLPEAREKLWALLASTAPPVEHDGVDSSAATTKSSQELWSGVLGVVFESAYAQHEWNLATALVSVGARVSRQDLHAAVRDDFEELAVALLRRDEVSVDATDELGLAPLHIAAQHGRARIAQLLLQKGADADKRDGEGRTPLFTAAEGGMPSVVRVLMVFGADSTISNDQCLPLEKAAENGHDEIVRVMIELGVDVNGGIAGNTALHAARGKVMVDMLVEAGADIEARRFDGATPLNTMNAEAESIETIRALVDHGADINTQDDYGDTPLHSTGDAPEWPEEYSGVERTDFLLRRGADETIVNKNNATVLETLPDRDDSGKCVKRMRQLLANAPADRAWRRRGLLLLCIARHRRRGSLPSAEGADVHGCVDAEAASIIEPASSILARENALDDWGGVVAWVLERGLGNEGIFRTVVGFL